MPETSEKILAQLNTKKRELDEMDTFGLYPSGNKVTDKPEILFARMDIKEVMAKVEEMHAAAATETDVYKRQQKVPNCLTNAYYTWRSPFYCIGYVI